MTVPLTSDSPIALAVRRAAVEAISFTPLGGIDFRSLARKTAGITEPSEAERHVLSHASNLARAYATLTGADQSDTMAELTQEARQLHDARFAAGTMWLRACAELGIKPLEVQLIFLMVKRNDPTIVAYAKAADIPYELACQNLYAAHAESCPQHGAKPPARAE
ncbi:MAG TPA: hypothetical protein VM581_02685 [Magnetospirillaceae bacterium]|nr:hypothetical protein [Magnetospirillaceae bacterium]